MDDHADDPTGRNGTTDSGRPRQTSDEERAARATDGGSGERSFPAVRRRVLLAGLAGLAGCASLPSGLPGVGGTATRTATPTPPDPTTSRPDTPRPTPTANRTAEPTPTPTPVSAADIGVRPDETACPVPEGTTRVVCHSEHPDSPVALRPLSGQSSLPSAGFEFRLRNGTERPFRFNPYGWGLWKRVDGVWHHVAPAGAPDLSATLRPGAVHAWSMTVDNGSLGSLLPVPEGGRTLSIGGLGGGQYGFTAVGEFADSETESTRTSERPTTAGGTTTPSRAATRTTSGTDRDEPTIGLAAQVRLDGPALELEPTDLVTGTRQAGDRLRVITAPRTDAEFRKVTAVATRATDPDATDLIVEQALRNRVVRDTIPFFTSGVDRVELEAWTDREPAFGIETTSTVRFGGETYQITVE